MKDYIKESIPRKFITASVSGSIFAILLGLLFASRPIVGEATSIGAIFENIFGSIPLFLIYSFPVIFIYGSVTSIISDVLGQFIGRYTGEKWVEVISFIFHILFGLILLLISLMASILFFVVDRYLRKKKEKYRWGNAILSLSFPLLVWILFYGIIWIVDFSRNWPDFIV